MLPAHWHCGSGEARRARCLATMWEYWCSA
ncbi:hypothetical protein GQ600_15125 [Phytophthora cactorum]|nr:hypothetical protein GQ600_15125 [Phytophthora cactorum]